MTSLRADLIERMRQADRTAFDDVIAWYAGDVIRLAAILLNDDDEARDVLQESMLRLVQMAKENKIRHENGSIKGLLMTTARNLCLNRLKQKKRFIESADEEWEDWAQFQDHHTPDRVVHESDFMTAFQKALNRLTPLQRVALTLRELQGESYRDIAQSLELSEDGVKKQVYRALQKLRTLLEPYSGSI
ncbi:MAG: sigma-70 family RNA polymerase sigma factor [Candidatus Omnitrophota bacterium]